MTNCLEQHIDDMVSKIHEKHKVPEHIIRGAVIDGICYHLTYDIDKDYMESFIVDGIYNYEEEEDYER